MDIYPGGADSPYSLALYKCAPHQPFPVSSCPLSPPGKGPGSAECGSWSPAPQRSRPPPAPCSWWLCSRCRGSAGGTRSAAQKSAPVAGNAVGGGRADGWWPSPALYRQPQDMAPQTNDRTSRNRKSSRASIDGGIRGTKDETPEVSIELLHTVQTDTSADTLQKAVCFNPDCTKLLTGGVDGYLRVWEFPGMKKLLDFKAHNGEIEDIASSPGNKVRCQPVWVPADQLLMELHWNENLPSIPDKMYRYRACRFGKVPDQQDALCLYTVQIPYKRERRPPPCYLTKWDGLRFLPLVTQPCGNEVISCLAVSDCGKFLGLGTVTGSVAIYISFSLQRLYYVEEAHGIVVTDLAFFPGSRRCRDLQGDHETALLSVAVDSRCKLHLVPNRRTFPVWLLLLLCFISVVLVVFLLQETFPDLL
uniref:Prolactin regulatory element binding n=1 Tax=Xenopus tropicalis TaxID=8364 RepID=A0A803K990_XENTR